MNTVIFDVDDTLYDQVLPFKTAFKRIFAEALTEQEIEKLYIVSRKYSDILFDKQQAGLLSLEELQIRRIAAACQEFDLPINKEKALEFQQAYVAGQQNITLHEEIAILLDRLHGQNKQLAVLTNGEEQHQSRKIKQLQLDKWIPEEHFFISGAIGHAKPAPQAFHYLEQKLQLDKNSTVYIGDSFDNDIIGAKRAGWQSVWLNHRDRSIPETDIRPDYTFARPEELHGLFR